MFAAHRAGDRVVASVSRFLTKKLRLKVNEAKSAVARPEERKFLGFSISNDGSERRIAPKALDKFKTQVRDKTRRTRGIRNIFGPKDKQILTWEQLRAVLARQHTGIASC